MSDCELLAEYVKTRSDAAFTQLMLRHVDLVYSSALRQTRDPDAAEEITQAVFVVLSQKAHSLGPREALSPWLYNATRIAALDAQRQTARRRHHEQRASSMAIEQLTAQHQSSAQWTEIAVLLDDALAGLNPSERAAIVLRYFENRTVRDVSGALGVSEDAGEKRVARALQKLRTYFARRGKMLSLPALALLIGTSAVHAAPANVTLELPAKVAAAKLGLAGTHLTLAKGVLKIMATNQMLKTAGLAAACVLFGSVGTLTVEHSLFGEPLVTPAAQPAALSPALDEEKEKPAEVSEVVPRRTEALPQATAAADGRQTVPGSAAAARYSKAIDSKRAPAKTVEFIDEIPIVANEAGQPVPTPGLDAPTAAYSRAVKTRSVRISGTGAGMPGAPGAGNAAPSAVGAGAAGSLAVPGVTTVQIDGVTGRITLDPNNLEGGGVYVIENIDAVPGADGGGGTAAGGAGSGVPPKIFYRASTGAPGKTGTMVLTTDELKVVLPPKPPTSAPKAPAKEKAKEEF